MREPGTVASVDGEIVRVRVGSELCQVCGAEGCRLQGTVIRATNPDNLPLDLGQSVEVSTDSRQVFSGVLRLLLLPVVVGVAVSVVGSIVLGVAAGFAVFAGALIRGNRRRDLPIVTGAADAAGAVAAGATRGAKAAEVTRAAEATRGAEAGAAETAGVVEAAGMNRAVN